MDFGSRLYYINYGNIFQGVLRINIVREFDKFLLKFDLLKFKNFDQGLCSLIEKDCLENPSRIEILNKVNFEIVGTCHLDYTETELFVPILFNTIDTLVKRNTKNEQLFNISIYNKLKVNLSTLQIKRVYNDIKSFYDNYFILESIFKIMLNLDTSKNDNSVVNKPKISDLVNINKQSEIINNKQQLEIKINQDIPKLDNILYFCINANVTTSLIHIVFNYYRFINESDVYISKEENKIIINGISLLPNLYLFDNDYFKNFIIALTSVEVSNILHHTNKLLILLKDELYQKNSLYINMISYLLMIYSLRCLHDTHASYFLTSFEEIISSTEIQSKLINHFINVYHKDLNQIEYKLIDKNIYKEDISLNDNIKNQIEKLRIDNQHIINVSEESFLKLLFKDIDFNEKKYPKEFYINKQEILNLNNLQKNKSSIKDNTIYDLFNYDFTNENKVLTKAYKYLLEYTQNPTIVMMIKDEEIPLTITKLFEILKNILNQNNFNKNNISTLEYYKIICNNLNNPNLFSNITILYIIYQIIIPYYYHMYNITIFNDYF